jgi:hypothetical protein
MWNWIWTPAVLGVAGGVLEVGALVWLAAQARGELVRRREARGLLAPVVDLARYVFEGPLVTVSSDIRIRYEIHGQAEPVTPIVGETDIDRLRREFAGLRERQAAFEVQATAEINKSNERWSNHYNDLSEKLNAMDEADRESRLVAWRRARWGVLVFGGGAILSALANVA